MSKKPPATSRTTTTLKHESMEEDSLPAAALPTGDVDMAKAADAEIASLESMAAGAFVHAVEDEYYQVREAAIESMCRLSVESGCPAFAERALDFLTDMLNDQIDSVRVRAVNALRTVAKAVPIQPEQLHTLLAALEESSSVVRLAIHEMLAEVALPNVDSTHDTIDGLLRNLMQNPEDRDSIFVALKGIGTKHAAHVKRIFAKLLHIDPRYEPVERKIDDPQYIACAIAIFNAARADNSIIPLLPKFALPHVISMHESFPELFPESLEVPPPPLQRMGVSAISATSPADSEVFEFFRTAVALAYSEGVRLMVAGKHGEALRLLIECSRDVRRSAVLDPALSSRSEFFLEHFSCIRAVVAMKARTSSPSTIVKKLLRGSYSLERCLYKNIPVATAISLRLMRCMAHFFLLVSGESESAATSFIQRLESLREFCVASSSTPPQQLIDLINESGAIVQTPGITMTTTGLSVLSQYVPSGTPIAPTSNVVKIVAKNILPESNPDKPIEFNPALPLVFTFRCRVANILLEEDLRTFLVKVRFRDGAEKYFPITDRHIALAGPGDSPEEFPADKPSVVFSVPISISWLGRPVGSSFLKVGLVKAFAPDVAVPDAQIPTLALHKSSIPEAIAVAGMLLSVPVCKPTTLYIVSGLRQPALGRS
jgi:integrator complex subunit 4